MVWVFLLVAAVVFMVVAVVAIRTWGAVVLRRLELEAQHRQAELLQRYVAGELNPAPVILGPSIDEIRKVVEKATWEAVGPQDWTVRKGSVKAGYYKSGDGVRF